MSTASKIGKTYYSQDFLKHIPDNLLLVEAAMRRGQALTPLIAPESPSLSRIDIGKWKQALMSAQNVDSPNRNPLYQVMDNILIDNSLTSIIDTRILKAMQSKFMVFDKNGKPDPESKKLFEKEWFGKFIKLAMTAYFEGPVLVETFDLDQLTGELKDCVRVNKYHVKPELGIVTKEASDDKGWSYVDNPFYILIGDKTDLGILHKAAPHILAKKFVLGTWAEFNEKIGIPFRTVNTNSTDSKRHQQLGVIMDKMGSAGWAVLNEGEKVSLLALTGTDPTKCFEQLCVKLDSEVAMLILGQSATSNSQNNKGTYGSMQILQDISNDRHESDLTGLKYLINGVLIPRLIELSPAYKRLTGQYLDWDKSEELNISETVDYIVKLSDVYDIDPEFVTQKTGIPVLGFKNQKGTNPTGLAKKKSLISSIKAFYSDNCCINHKPVAVDKNGFEPDILRLAKALWEGKQKGIVDMDLLKKTASELRKGLMSGYSTSTDDKDVEMLKALESNVYVFSGFKTYKQLKEISGKLKDDNGDLRSFEDFKKEVLKVNQAYNVHYLSAEYDHAVVSSQMASQWLDIQANKDVLPYLEFDATLDDRTTSTCRSLDGTRLPVDDPFWETYYLPLHYRERSALRQVASGKLTDKSKLVYPEIQPMFKGNVGLDKIIFPESHPYFDVKQAKDKKRIQQAAYQVQILAKPRLEQFETSFTNKKNNATVKTHALGDKKKDDYKNNLSIAKAFTNNGISCELLPEINFKEIASRKEIFPKLKSYCNPDLLTSDGEYIDIKRFENINNIVKQANRADKQGAIVCISDEWHKLTDAIIEDKAKQIFKSPYKGDKIYFYKDGKLIVKNRKGGK